jgi:hypothetical protein
MPRMVVDQIPGLGVSFANNVNAIATSVDNANLRVETTSKFTWSYWLYCWNLNNNTQPFFMVKGAIFAGSMGDQNNGRRNEVAVETVNNSNGLATEFWGGTRLPLNTWVHIVNSFDDGTLNHYINGVAESITQLANPYVSPLASTVGSPLCFGNRYSFLNKNLQGVMAKVRVFNRALTAVEVLKMFTADSVTSGRVGKWDCNENTGNTAADSSGNGYDATLTSTSWQSV